MYPENNQHNFCYVNPWWMRDGTSHVSSC